MLDGVKFGDSDTLGRGVCSNKSGFIGSIEASTASNSNTGKYGPEKNSVFGHFSRSAVNAKKSCKNWIGLTKNIVALRHQSFHDFKE